MRSERARPGTAAVAGAALAAAGLLAVLALVPLQLAPGTTPVLAATALALVLLAVTGDQPGRLLVLAAGGLALAGLGALAAAPSLLLTALLLLGLAAGQAALPGRRTFATRLRGPALGVLLLGLGDVLARASGVAVGARMAALLMAVGLVAALGLLPYLQELAPGEGLASPTWWLAFCGPLVALALARQVPPLLPAGAVPVFGALLLGLGLVNAALGPLAAWRAPGVESAWRYSFVGDFGLVLVGLGLGPADGQAAAVLILVTVLVGRLPAYAWAGRRPAGPGPGPLVVLLAALLAGAAPFGGFAARILLLRGASELAWPLALALALAMLLWVPASLRLAQGLGRPTPRQAAGLVAVVALNVVLGLYPAPLLALI